MIEDKRKIVTEILGNYWQKGDEHLYHCPYCKHHKKKMSINFANGYGKCWVCDARGKNIYRIVRKFGSYQQRERYRQLQGLIDLTDFEQLFKEYNHIEDKQIIELPKEFISLLLPLILALTMLPPNIALSKYSIFSPNILSQLSFKTLLLHSEKSITTSCNLSSFNFIAEISIHFLSN